MAKLLIVDDEPDVREFGKNFFLRRKLEVFTASSGEEAVLKVNEVNPDLVLLDVRMEGMDGLTTLEKIRQIKPQIKVIMVTGVEEPESMNKAKRLGAVGYIHKPLILDELEQVVMKEIQK